MLFQIFIIEFGGVWFYTTKLNIEQWTWWVELHALIVPQYVSQVHPVRCRHPPLAASRHLGAHPLVWQNYGVRYQHIFQFCLFY